MSSSEDVCCICLEAIVEQKLPITLNCHHKFCFLCIKGSYERNPICPLCRTTITADIIKNTTISPIPETVNIQWFYSGRNSGWWMYDPVTSRELEDNYQKYVQKLSKTSENDELNLNNSEFTISIMGREYQIDFQNMEQIGYENTRTIRRGKDDAISCIKGIAGLKISS